MNDNVDLGDRFVREVLAPMKHTFVGKDEIIDLMGICLVGGENLFILGPPGTAKSALVHELGLHIDGRTFEYLLTRFTEPNELFGPFDIRRLREGELVTNTEGMLPEAALVFLDELLNANSAILNSLLTVLNERMFRRGREAVDLPLLMAIGASNHLPEDEALGALFDRFLLRVRCDNVEGEKLDQVLQAGWRLDMGLTERAAMFSVDDIRTLQSQLTDVDLSNIQADYVTLVRRLRSAGIPVSDRRAVKLQRLIASSAILCGRKVATLSDVWPLKYIWDREEQQEVLAALVGDAIKKDESDLMRHPRAEDIVDPEALARDLDQIAGAAGTNGGEAERAVLRDRLGVLAGRCQWVPDEKARGFLLEKVDDLWKRVGVADDVS